MKHDEVKALVEGMAPEIVRAIDARVQPLKAEVDALRAWLAEVAAAPFSYEGPHEQGRSYRRGMFTTWNGGIWHANHNTAARPGDGPSWTLAVKAGRDAR